MKNLRWSGDIGWRDNERNTGITVDFVESELTSAAGDDITVEFDSIGGDYFSGIQIMTMLKGYKGKKIVKLGAIVASAATAVMLGFDQRIARRTTSFMIHNAQSGQWGDQNDLRKMADQLEGYSNIIAQEYADLTGKTIEEIKALMDAETWLFGKEIVDNGFAEMLEDVQADGSVSNKMVAVAMYKKRLEIMNKAGVNHRPETVREFEALLRDVGYSKAQATAIASVGFRAGADKEGDKEVTKEEILAAIKTTPGITLQEIAVTMGVKPEEPAIMVQLRAEGITDPVAEIKRLREVEMSVAADRVRMALDKEFGAEGPVRSYASKTFLKLDAITPEAIAEFKKDPIAIALAASSVDHTSGVNLIREPGNNGNKTPKTEYGVPVEEI